MKHFTILALSLLTSLLSANAAVTVNDPISITHFVSVNVIQTNNGTDYANAFGNETQRAYIETEVNRIWAQVGVQIQFSSTITPYNNSFAFDGNGADYTSVSRSTSDLNTIVSQGDTNGVGSSDFANIDLYFVNVVPGFTETGTYTANGLAFVDGNGVAMYAGTGLYEWEGGLDVIAAVLAHEIGHNLGLPHTANGGDNLMSPSGSEDRLTQAQRDIIFTDTANWQDGFDLLQLYTVPEPSQTMFVAIAGVFFVLRKKRS